MLGLVDPRLRTVSDGTGRTDRRVVEALRKIVDEQTDRSTVSAQVLRRRMERLLEAEHGPGVVPLPSRATFYRLLNAVSFGRHTLGSARTRRSLAKQPDGMFGQLTAARPGEVMEIDSTPLDVLVVHDDGTVDTVELTGIVDIATRTLAAAVLRPSTKAVDAALLLARAMTPEPMRPGWADALRMSRSVLPHTSPMALDERLAQAAAVPVITPETIVCDRGKAYISDTFRSACQSLGISFQPAHPDTPTDKPHIEKTLGSVATMFVQHLPGHKGRSTEHRGAHPAAEAVWTIHQLRELLQEWIVHWQNQPHDGLRDPLMPGKALSPNEKYAALVAAAGHVPIALSPDEYIELLPRHWRTINSYGIRINHRTYDSTELNPFRRRPSGMGPDGRSWEVHYDPYDISRVWVRNHPPRQLDHRCLAASSHRTDAHGRAGLGPCPPHSCPARHRSCQRGRDRPGRPRAAGSGQRRTTRVRGHAGGAKAGQSQGSQGRRPHPHHQCARPALDAPGPTRIRQGRQRRRRGRRTRRRHPAGDLRRQEGGRTMVVKPPEPDEDDPAGEPRTDPSTTLAGWRYFVDADPATFDLLPDDRWQTLDGAQRDAYDEARIAYHSELQVVRTSTVKEIAHQGRLLTLLNQREHGARRGLIVSGEWTTGKTTALKQLARLHELRVRQR